MRSARSPEEDAEALREFVETERPRMPVLELDEAQTDSEEDSGEDWLDAEEVGAAQGSLPHQPSETFFTWLMPRLPWFQAQSSGNASQEETVSAVLQMPDQYGTAEPVLAMATTPEGGEPSTSVTSSDVDLEQVSPSNTNPPHAASN